MKRDKGGHVYRENVELPKLVLSACSNLDLQQRAGNNTLLTYEIYKRSKYKITKHTYLKPTFYQKTINNFLIILIILCNFSVHSLSPSTVVTTDTENINLVYLVLRFYAVNNIPLTGVETDCTIVNERRIFRG